MASARAQLEELEKPDPRYVLELNSIRGMIQEADNMDKSLKTVLGIRMQGPMMPSGGIPSAPQGTPPPASTVSTALFAPPIDPPPLRLFHAHHTPPLCSQHTERSHPKHRPLKRHYLPQCHRLSRQPLLLHEQRHQVLLLRHLRHRSLSKGRPLRSQNLLLLARCR